MPFLPTFDHVWDITQPPDTQLASLGASDFSNLKDDVMQRMSLISGTLANRPTPEIVNATWGGAGFGLLYFSTDNGKFYQWNGAAWVDVTTSFLGPAGGVPGIVASPSFLAQGGNIASTTLYAVPASGGGRYRVSAYMVLTQRASVSSTLPNLNIAWTDLDTSSAFENYNYFNPADLGSLAVGVVPSQNSSPGALIPGMIVAKASTNILISTTGYASSGATPMQYSLRVTLEFLGA